jgi:transcriptional regulator with XRE-family HTH domain
MQIVTAESDQISLERDIARCYGSPVTFGDLCRELREERGLSQRLVAKAGGIPDAARVSEIERGAADPSVTRARQLARGLGVLLTELVARWEGIDLVWTTAGRKAIAETKGDVDVTEVARRGGVTMADDLGESLLTTLGLVPAEQREDFVEHCFETAMSWRKARHTAAATGTDGPKG